MRYARGSLAVAVILAAAAFGGEVHADTIFDNGGPYLSQGQRIDHWIEADDFALAVDSTITGVRFWSTESGPGYAGSIEWLIYSDAAGVPGTILYQGNASDVNRSAVGSYGVTQNDFAIGDVYLAAGSYWLGLHNGSLSTVSDLFGWTVSSTSGNNRATTTDGDPANWFGNGYWALAGRELAFQLIGHEGAPAVPEPTTIGLLGIGLVAIARMRRR